ncbi:type IV secretion system protein VirB4, partial [Streptococcus suis]
MLEPYEGKLSRTVLREEGCSNTTNLLDYSIICLAFGGESIDIAPD